MFKIKYPFFTGSWLYLNKAACALLYVAALLHVNLYDIAAIRFVQALTELQKVTFQIKSHHGVIPFSLFLIVCAGLVLRGTSRHQMVEVGLCKNKVNMPREIRLLACFSKLD